MGKNDLEKSEATNIRISKNINSNSQQFLEKRNEHPEWLPDGWNVDLRTRKSGAHMGAGYKCYIDPLNGYKFYSKPEVLRYLETVKGSNCTFNKGKECTAEHSPSNLSTAAKRQKLKDSETKLQLFAGKEVSDNGILELSDSNSSEKGQDVKVSTEVMVTSVPTDEIVVKMHSLEDAAANPPEIKKYNPADLQEKNYIASLMENANEMNYISPSISKNKKELNVPRRFSRRLAGIRPDQVANTVTHEQVPQVPKRNLRKSRTTVDADLENKSSRRMNVVPEIKHEHKMHGELLDESSSSEKELVFSDQARQLVTEKIDDKKLEHQHSLSQDSSLPILKAGMKTIMGELPDMDNPHTGHDLASEANILKENKLHVTQTGKSGLCEIHVNLNKSSNKKEHCKPYRASKRLAGLEPELGSNTIDCKRAPEYKSRRSKGEANAVSKQCEVGPAKELADHASTYINAPITGGSSNKSRKSPKIPSITYEQSGKLGDEEMDDEKSEPQLSIAFHYSWSDPCLEFAIKTVTGALSVEDSVGNGPILAPETDLSEKNRLFESAKESGSDRNPHVNLKKSKNKKELRLPRRLSKRLAGHEPEVLPAERALEYATRKSCKDEPTDTVVLTNGASKHHDAGKETELTLHASNSLRSKVSGESPNKSEKSYEAQIIPKEQQQKLETEKFGDLRSETQLCLPFGKEIELTLHASDSLETRVLEESSSKSEKLYEAQTFPKQQQQKLETENLGDVRSDTQLCLPFGKETELALYASDSLETRVLEESSNKSEKAYEAQNAPKEEQKKLETEKFRDGRSETQLCLLFAKETEAEPDLHAFDSLETGVLEEPSNMSEKSYEAQTVLKEQQQMLETEKVCDVRTETQLCLLIEGKTELTLRASNSLESRALEESSNKSEKLYEAQTVLKGQQQMLETEKVCDVRTETQLCLSIEEKTELTLRASNSLESRALEESSNKSEKLYEAQTVPQKQQQKLETEKVCDVRIETLLCSPIEKETGLTLHASDSFESRVLEESLNNSESSYEAQNVPNEEQWKLEAEKVCDVRTETLQCLTIDKETELTLHASDSLESRVLEEPSNKSDKSFEAQIVEESNKIDKSYEVQAVPKEQHQKLEGENFGDVRSEPQLCLSFGDSWSDPCLEFAIKTLTGALPVDAGADILPAMAPDINNQPNKELLESVLESINEESPDDLNQSRNNKDINLVFQPSKQPLKQSALRMSSTSCEDAPKFANRVSYGDEGNITWNLDEGESLHMEAENITKLVHHSRKINKLIHEESSKKIEQVLEGEALPAEQPHFEIPIINHEKPESQLCDPFMDSWSDSCLEFAFKTLTGDITVEENFAILGSLQESTNWHCQRDGDSTLPDFGSGSFSQSDISSYYYDIGEKSMPGQQASMSIQGCAVVDPQQHDSQSNKNFQGR